MYHLWAQVKYNLQVYQAFPAEGMHVSQDSAAILCQPPDVLQQHPLNILPFKIPWQRWQVILLQNPFHWFAKRKVQIKQKKGHNGHGDLAVILWCEHTKEYTRKFYSACFYASSGRQLIQLGDHMWSKELNSIIWNCLLENYFKEVPCEIGQRLLVNQLLNQGIFKSHTLSAFFTSCSSEIVPDAVDK